MRFYKRKFIFFIVLHLFVGMLPAQETSNHLQEQSVEQLGESESFMAEDDASVMHYQYLLQHPLDINKVEYRDLVDLNILSPIQINTFLSYRKLNHCFISIYELQAIPYWDLTIIQKLLPYIFLSDHYQRNNDWEKSWREGICHIVLGASIKTSQFSDPSLANQKHLSGSNERAYLRYKYQYKKSLQYGLTAEKDAGEAWFKGAQQYGFDFYSAHISMTNIRRIKTLIIGDYAVNLGQGLMMWQSMAFRKSSEVMSIKRQDPVIRPYHSFGEYLFQRGVASTFVYRSWSITGFVSLRQMDAVIRTDSVRGQKSFSSINSSGLHRTISEINNKGLLPMFTGGSSLKYERFSGHAAINFLYTDFGDIIQYKERKPYNLYAWQGHSYSNMSMDGAYTFKNIHVFGEYALHNFREQAFLGGIMMSLDPKADLSLIYRNMTPGYQSHFGNAFTESTLPTNEKGLYTGLTLRPAHTWLVNMYADIFHFPWLRYAVDAPSRGNEYMIQVSRSIRRESNFYIRYRVEEKQKNVLFNEKNISEGQLLFKKTNIRAHAEFNCNKKWTFRNRVELVHYREAPGIHQSGFLCFMEAFYKPPLRPFVLNMRLQYFEVDNYNSRVYAYEQDLLYQFSIPAFYGTGYKFYLNGRYKLNKSLSFWLRYGILWQQDETTDEVKFQIQWMR